jgi:hypothetical protein
VSRSLGLERISKENHHFTSTTQRTTAFDSWKHLRSKHPAPLFIHSYLLLTVIPRPR